MRINRDVYLNRLVSRMRNGMVKVVTGIRRCGKTYLLFELFTEYLREHGVPDENIIRIRLDEDEEESLRDPHELGRFIRGSIADAGREYFVLIDEAQLAITKEEMKDPDKPIALYGVLNGLLNRGNVDVYITGSNSKFLSKDVMTEFRGRGDEVHIAPLSFSEFMGARSGDVRSGWREYSLYGGLPHILEEQGDGAKAAYLKRLNTELYVRDLVERYGIRNDAGLEETMKVLASSIGSLTNPQRISDTFKSSGRKGVSAPTVAGYLDHLVDAFVFQKAERYDIRGRQYISTPAKYYSTDLGLRNALLNFRQYEETHLMENAIYNELIYRGYNVDVGVVETEKAEGGKRRRVQLEVDFVANAGARRYYIQSAYAIPDMEKMAQEQRPFERIPDSFKKIIVTREGDVSWTNEQGISIVTLFDFLLDPYSLDR